MLTRLILSALVAIACAAAGELRLRVVDLDEQPVWARFEVRDADGQMYRPVGAMRDVTATSRAGGEPWYIGSFVAKDDALLELPPGRYTVVAERGPEFQRYEHEIEIGLKGAVDLVIPLRPWIRMNEKGWWSADFHVHRRPEDVEKLLFAEDLNLAVVFTMWNKRDLFEGEELPKSPLRKIDDTHWLTLNNAEDERGGGAWMFHNLRAKLPLGVEGRWHPAGLRFISEAKRQRYVPLGFPWFDVEKPFWWEVPVVMALSPPDSIGLLHNHFNQYGVHAEEAWGRPRDRETYPGNQGFVDSSLELIYRYWNLGLTIPFSAGSASGVLPNPVGYNRVYVKLNEPPTLEAFYRGFRQNESFVTNGPMLFFDAVELPGNQVRIWVDAQSREPLDRIEIVANGEVVQTFEAPEGKMSFSTELTVGGGLHSWIAARCYTKNDSTIRMAHSRAITLQGAWGPQADAVFFIRWIDELIEESLKDPERFGSEAERNQVLSLYEQARGFYESKL